MLGCVSSVFHRFIFTEVETVETDRVNVPKSVCFLVNQRAVRSTADFVRGIVAGSAARRKNRVRIHGFNVNLLGGKNTYEKIYQIVKCHLGSCHDFLNYVRNGVCRKDGVSDL